MESIPPEWMVCQLILRLNIVSLSIFHIGEKTFEREGTLLHLGWSSCDHDFAALEYKPAVLNDIQRVVESVVSTSGANRPARIINGIRQALKVQ
jgi:hypothetical protein